MTRQRALALALAAAALAAACQPWSHEGRERPAAPRAEPPGREGYGASSRPPGVWPEAGLGRATAFVTVIRGRRTARLDPGKSAEALQAVQRVLDRVGALTPESGGPRLLANLRLNEYLLDVAVWTPQALIVAGRRLTDVSGIVIPFTGKWRNRVLIVREGEVEASPVLLENPDLAGLERVVESAAVHP